MEAWTSVVVVKVVELTARGRASRGKPAGGVGDEHHISRVVAVAVVSDILFASRSFTRLSCSTCTASFPWS